ncbi:MAG TPA: hypothetical protein VG738_22925 [Chitinophagaceae bacterium]|nr:hypothetical protein [Chitinophagaceae bacterium]
MNYGVIRRFLTILLCFGITECFCQPGTTVELTKPKQYENRTLGSEKTGDKKFTLKRRLYQGMVTHYNYYFNANNRLNDIVDRAKMGFKDDYTKLLPFYNYSLDVTAQDGDLDSVLYKCNAGILLHDLRNAWIDNMYLLMGKAYFFRKNFDSAEQVFQYINYAFAPQDKDGYRKPIGSNESGTNGVFSVSTEEDRSILQKIMSQPPSRNDALLWQAKTYVEEGKYGEAAGLLQILKSDPQFPERLLPPLHEAIAYWCYKQNIYDSAAWHLSKALDNVENREEKARREFLIAQLYLLSKNDSLAIAYYNKAAEHTIDPIMDVYANLNSINAYNDKSGNVLQEKINNLTKLAHRDRYITNRDIIYYAIAKIEVQKNDIPAAKQALHKSVAATVNNLQQKSRSFLMLADLDYDSKEFVAASNCYDSVSVSYITNEADKNRLQQRMAALKIIVQGLADIHTEDSLQAIAAMPKAAQEAVIKKMIKQLKKQQGIKDEENASPNINPAVRGNQPAATDLFATSSGAAQWYFNNNALKAQGYNTFRQQWGNRPNVDNWRRQAAVNKALASNALKTQAKADSMTAKAAGTAGELSYDVLYANLPTTPEKLKASNEKIAKALFTNAQAFQNKLEDYNPAVDTYDTLNLKYDGNSYEEEALFNLYYCYTQLVRPKQADSVKNVLNTRFAKGKFTATLQKGPAGEAGKPDAATEKYVEIYNLFVEGKFEEAKDEKAKADKIYGNSHWTPQLLFIEAIYYVSKREDSAAINRLNSLAKMYPSSPIAERATTMISVLQRRSQIESYLTQLQITRYKEDESAPIVFTTPAETVNVVKVPAKIDSVAKPVSVPVAIKVDSLKAPTFVVKKFEFIPSDPQYVSILLDKVAPVFANEAGNAFNRYNMTTYYSQRLKTTSIKLDDRYNIVLIGPFKDAAAAIDYVNKTRPITGGRILPWLTANKYSFSMISEANLSLLKETKDVDGYKQLLQTALPGQF